MFSTALKQMAFYPTQELIKHVCIAKGGTYHTTHTRHTHDTHDTHDSHDTRPTLRHDTARLIGMSEERGQFFSSMFAGMVLGLLAAPINVIKVPLQVATFYLSFLFFSFSPSWPPLRCRDRARLTACRVPCVVCRVSCVSCVVSCVSCARSRA
jgi:hypothetical protein